MTAAAVVEAKDEVLQRKRELDATKDRMDTLVERLYGHREANISLSGAIGAAAGYQQVDCWLDGGVVASCGRSSSCKTLLRIGGWATSQLQNLHLVVVFCLLPGGSMLRLMQCFISLYY
jgi:hypothetical protein